MPTLLRQFEIRLPANPDRRKACEDCILKRLKGHEGIGQVNLKTTAGSAQVELEYDPTLLTVAELERELVKADACLCGDIAHMIVPVRGMVSPRTEQTVNAVLNKLPGVHASASYPAQSVRLEFDRTRCPLPEILLRLEHVGISADFSRARLVSSPELAVAPVAVEEEASWPRIFASVRENPEAVFSLMAGSFLLAGFLVHLLGGPNWLRILLIAASYVSAARFTGLEAWGTLRNFRFNIDVLMFAAAFGAAAIGHYEEGALLLFLFSLGNAGEHMALERARHAISALSTLAPETASVRGADGVERLTPVGSLAIEDCIVIRPFERVPADGLVSEGESAVDQSPITGESMPVAKKPGAKVFAGTINGEGRLSARVTKLAHESTLAKIIKLVEEAQTTRSPTQHFADSLEHWYVPLVLIGAVVLIFLPPLAFAGVWSVWFYRSMGFLTAASPCALAIGTPAAVLCGIARSARMGVLLKGGIHLENLGGVRAIAFDKTGTLTIGRPMVTDIVSLDGRSEDELLALAAAVEKQSNHPLAAAIVAEAQGRELTIGEASAIEQLSGQGISGTLDGRRIFAGQAARGDEEDPAIAEQVRRLSALGRTTVRISIDGVAAGVIGLADEPRENAAAVLRQLKAMGLERTIMLTGDHPAAAAEIARQIGVDEVHSNLLPEEKLSLMREQLKRYGRVAMVGDGVNDAPALAFASVGIAMGGAAADVAMETADVVLMSSDLQRLPQAIALSRASRRIIVQNLVIALGVIAVMAPAAALGLTTLGLAVLCHEGSTVVVVLNALRLLGWRGEEVAGGV